MLTWTFRLLVLSAVGLLCVAAYRFVGTREQETDVGERLVVDRPERDLGELTAGKHVVEFAITNTGLRTRRFVGGSVSACIPNCCYVPQEGDENAEIAPGETFVYRCELDVKGGPFEFPLTIYADDGHLRTIVLKIRGVGVVGGDLLALHTRGRLA